MNFATRTLLFVDDHPIYRDGLQQAVKGAVPDLRVLIADGVGSAWDLLQSSCDVDLCLADYRLGDGDGLSLIARVRGSYPDTAIGLLCADPSPEVVMRVKAMGGVACLSKDRDIEALSLALEEVFAGGTVFDDMPLPASHFRTLSIRRREILLLAATGLLDKQIGDRLGISESTVRNHWHHIFATLGAGNRTEAVFKATRSGFI
ncbi:response regulator transcription factor [Bradyrhizobium sp. INPA01-394B]|uniref:Response regulator transcription factor n=1 Tax=Bradyrhizobium campsiandrae TaxID=1729892 RepID=A0ABR7UG16_9BRAD|nr:response regulator transcription factor [Bradyrhizobium campsiandrae]MBC9878342.1 response regulator transcription factor [Bradyrhizobium campsiandrae]MBC9982424.1 response regulator transcription factor [Bradyrhizobium campsiandrae]